MFKFLFLLCLESVFASTITEDIARIVRGYVEDLTPGEITEKIELHYQLLGLMDDNGDWVHDYFKAFPNPAGLYLFPTSVTSLDLMQLVDDMAENASNNPYILRALDTLKDGNYPTLQRKLLQEGKEVIPNVVTLAFVLEKMTATMKQDLRFLEVCKEIWSDFSKTLSNTLALGKFFSLAKVLSVEEVIKRRIQTLKSQELRKEFAINSLTVNIMEAVLEDERLGHFDNAYTGEFLAKYTHSKEYDPRTGSGPCQFSSSLQSLECPQPLPLHWADLYSTWNMAFVSGFPDFVYYLPKLLIPSVSNYQDNPAEYINTRVLALYTFIHWTLNWNNFNNNEMIQWSEVSLTRDWGAANKNSTRDYVNRLAEALSTTPEQVESVPRPNFLRLLNKFALNSAWLPLKRAAAKLSRSITSWFS